MLERSAKNVFDLARIKGHKPYIKTNINLVVERHWRVENLAMNIALNQNLEAHRYGVDSFIHNCNSPCSNFLALKQDGATSVFLQLLYGGD